MIIAEVGLNHMGLPDLAEEYVRTLVSYHVDGISFQIREPEYYLNPKKSHYKLDLSEYIKLSNITKNAGKKFGIAVADIAVIDFLESIDTDFYKIIRNDITNIELVDKLISTGKKIIVSTGMSSDEDISSFMKHVGANDNIVLNHTQLSYDEHDCNLSAIKTLKDKYNCNVSYGNHCANVNTIYMALCYEPSDILIYVKGTSLTFTYPDDKHAIPINRFGLVCRNLMINKIETVT